MTDSPTLQDWLGRQQTSHDNLDEALVRRIAATFGVEAPAAGQSLPPLWQWAFFIDPVEPEALGEDGHPARGGFLPPADNRNRMWAGGRVSFIKPLRAGVPATRTTTIQSIEEKTGRTGQLLFVTLLHEYSQGGELAISEEQDIVYRSPAPPKLEGSLPAPQAEWQREIRPDSTLLFRYSAVTFNGHRIHYDHPYCTDREGYPGLVVHGPLIATLMLDTCLRQFPGSRPRFFSYRGLRPLIAPALFRAAGRLTQPGHAELWAEQGGTLAHQASLEFDLQPEA
ncbi:itaconyl-CoA hydratase [Alcaligenaceae bacterium SJ-26]|nr:itaconyl-CoA hydratase [Alcaligenaceae bacterium SJ-26]